MTPLLRSLALLCALLPLTNPLRAAKWDDIDPADFNAERSAIDPEANVEVIFKDVEVAQYFYDWQLRTSYRVYVRMKVFDDVGVERLTRAEFPYQDYQRVAKIEARTVKPDGRSVELDPKTIYETEIVKNAQGKLKAKAFAFPALEAGDIVEVRLELQSTNVWTVPFSFAEEYPSRRTSFRVKPADTTRYFRSQLNWFNFPEADGKSKGGFYTFERFNQPPSSDEEYRIPEFHTDPYVVAYYHFEEPPRTSKYWKETGQRLFRDSKKDFSANRAVKEKAEELIAGAASDSDRLKRLYDFCISKIQNREHDFGEFSAIELDEMKENKSAGDTLDRGNGSPEDIARLFGALATAAGFDARLAAVADKRVLLFSQNLQFPFALSDRLIAVRLEGDWRYFNPGNPNLPFGTVDWWHADSDVLLADPKKEVFSKSPQLPAADSAIRRSGKLTVDARGTLSGKVTQVYTGYEAVELRGDMEDQTAVESKEMIRQRIQRALPQASLENITFENLRDPYQPMVVTYDLAAPGYAEIVGERLFIQPAVFQKGRSVPFQQHEERTTAILFSYPWLEQDELTLVLPEGYVMDSGQAPEPFAVEGVLAYQASFALGKNQPVARLDRSFQMEHSILSAKAHPLLRQVYANLQIQDGYALTYTRSSGEQTARN